MSLIVNVPDDVARRLRAAAAANGVSVDEFLTAMLINSVPEVADASGRRHEIRQSPSSHRRTARAHQQLFKRNVSVARSGLVTESVQAASMLTHSIA